MSKKAYLALCFNFSFQTADAGQWLPMIPAGRFTGRDGRSWVNDNPDAVVAMFDAKLPFDIEHATEIKAAKGEEAPAVGWMTELQNRDGEIWAKVEWNHSGQYRIEDKQYCYYSPAFSFDESGSVLAMSSAGFTNKPNLHVPALNREDDTMNLAALIAAALGLPETATVDQGVVAINTLKKEKQVALNSAQNPDLNKFVPKETYDIALNRATAAEAIVAKGEASEQEALVDAAIDAGKVAPANKAMYVGLCRTEEGRGQFKSFVESAAPVVTDKQTKTPPQTATNSQLEPHEIALCRKMGVSQEDFLKTKESMKKEA